LVSVINNSQNERVETLENEIRGYKNMTEGCVRSCNTLTEEIVMLKKEIEKYATGYHKSMSASTTSLFKKKK
jgi:archaellum component FlaC